MNAKYIIVEYLGLELPIVFNPIIDHSMIATCFGHGAVVSAGKCVLGDENLWSCYGESVTLGIKSKPEDAIALNKSLLIDG